MADIDAVKQAYPEAALLVDLARNVWNGHSPTVKIEFAVSDRLKAEFFHAPRTRPLQRSWRISRKARTPVEYQPERRR